MNQKLTLSVDSAAVERGKNYAACQGVSLSGLVEDFLLFLDDEGDIVDSVPISPKLQSLVGIGAGSCDEASCRTRQGEYHD